MKRGVTPIIATVLLVLLTLISTGVVSYFVIPIVSKPDTSCLDALKAIEFANVGFSCKLNDPQDPLTSFSVRINSPEVIGFDVGFKNEGSADTFAVKDGTSYGSICELYNGFNEPLSLPEAGGVRTYITRGIPEEIFISPILSSGKSCYSEGRKEFRPKVNCVDASVKTSMRGCLSSGEFCGNNICASGENQNNCPQDCGQPACQITSLSWSTLTAVEGQVVNINVGGTNCGGKSVRFEVREDDGVSFDAVQTNPVQVTFPQGANSVSTNWNAEWQCDGNIFGVCTLGNPEYFIFAELTDGSTTSFASGRDSLTELVVTKSSSVCMNGIQEAGEQCDDGNAVNTDGCTNTCNFPICGDNIIQSGEQCDGNNPACTTSLGYAGVMPCNGLCNLGACESMLFCGDGICTNPPENGATCADCAVCGNGVTDINEQCDDSNGNNADACNSCQLTYCGDGIVQAPNGNGQTEQCEGSQSESCSAGGGTTGMAVGGGGPGGGGGPSGGTRTCNAATCIWNACQ